MNPEFQMHEGSHLIPKTHDEVDEEMHKAVEEVQKQLTIKQELIQDMGPRKSTDPPADLPMHNYIPEPLPVVEPPPKKEPKRADRRTINRKRAKDNKRFRTCACCVRRLPIRRFETPKSEFCNECRK